MLILGVVVSSLAMPPILNLLNDAYGFGTNGLLPAPQASLMLSVSKGVIMGGLPWGWVGIGGVVALVVIGIDTLLKKFAIPFAMPVLGFAVGFCRQQYFFFLITYRFATRHWSSNHVLSFWITNSDFHRVGATISALAEGSHTNEASTGVLYAGGLITGEALMGIFLAIPIAISGNTSILHVLSEVLL